MTIKYEAMDWIDITNKKPNAGNFETIDVWVCCGSTTYAASWIKHRDDKEGRFYLDLNYPKKIFEDITSHVTHWQYTVYPWEGKPEATSENSLHKHGVISTVCPRCKHDTKWHVDNKVRYWSCENCGILGQTDL